MAAATRASYGSPFAVSEVPIFDPVKDPSSSSGTISDSNFRACCSAVCTLLGVFGSLTFGASGGGEPSSGLRDRLIASGGGGGEWRVGSQVDSMVCFQLCVVLERLPDVVPLDLRLAEEHPLVLGDRQDQL